MKWKCGIATVGLGLLIFAVGCAKSEPSAAGSAKLGESNPRGKKTEGRPHFAFITNAVASFWVIGKAGAKAAGEEVGAEVTVLMPSEGAVGQKRMIEDMLAKGVDGMAVSPIDPDNQNDLLNKAAQVTNLITHDSDAPGCDRLAYVGMDNYVAGRLCGELVEEALPAGGKIAIFIGRLEQDNAKRRRQGVIDQILGRSHDPSRYDSPDSQIKEGKWHIVGTYTDQFDRAQGKANAEDAMSRHPDLAGMVGLFVHNPPLMLEALKQGHKLGKIKVIGFDEADETLQGIIDGYVVGTVVQNPYEYGQQSIRLLAGLAQGKTLDELNVPADRFINIPARKIRQDNVDAFWAEMKKNLGE